MNKDPRKRSEGDNDSDPQYKRRGRTDRVENSVFTGETNVEASDTEDDFSAPNPEFFLEKNSTPSELEDMNNEDFSAPDPEYFLEKNSSASDL